VKRRRRPLRLALVSSVLLLAALEIAVRVSGIVKLDSGAATPHQTAFNAAGMFVSDDDPALSYRNRPDAATTVDGIEYRHDALGRRVLPEPSAAASAVAPAGAQPHKPRVAFLGDSTTYGLGLPAGDTLPAQVTAALEGAIVPLDLGVCGYGSGQELALYTAERESLKDVELIVLVVFPNDFAPGTFRYDERLHLMYLDPLPVPHALKGLLWRSDLYRWIVSGAAERLRQSGQLDPLNAANHEQALTAVRRLAEQVAVDGHTLLVAHLPAMEALDPYLFQEPVDKLAQVCAQANLPYIDLLPAFLAEREQQCAAYTTHFGHDPTATERAGFLAQYWIDATKDHQDHHLNAAANRIAAAALAQAIADLLHLPAPAAR
jgi:lysophospholipase L1-like esterase